MSREVSTSRQSDAGVRTRVRTTCPRDCYDGCGIEVELEDGAIRRVLGDPDHPVSRGALCGKCALAYNGAWIDPAQRLTSPLMRVGAKGEGAFESISWSRATTIIAERFNEVIDRTGAASIVHAHYTGTCSLLAGEFPLRLFNRLGATEVEPDTICNNAGHVALDYVYGTSTRGFDPRTIADARTIMVWGANPSACGPHVDRYWLGSGTAEVIVIDPVRTDTAARAALHLQPRPGTDAALAFAMMHEVRRLDLIDHAGLEAHALGWHELDAALDGCTLEWATALTGVPAADIARAAKAYAVGPSLLWIGQGLQRQPYGGNAVRACAMLPAVTGNIGRPGTGFLYLNGAESRGLDTAMLAGAELRRGPAVEPLSHMELADALIDPRRVGAFACWNMNVAASGPRQRQLRDGLSREDLFTVVIDLFATDTVKYADIVLPAASFLEFDDLVVPYFHSLLSAQVKVQPPPGEALSNMEIFRRLAAAMGFDDAQLYTDDRELIDTLLLTTGNGINFASLAAKGSITVTEMPLIEFADGRFPTPSGRIELASERAQRDGHSLIAVPHADPPPPPGVWRLLSPAGDWLMNGSYHNDSHIARKLGEAAVWIHPDDAAHAGVVDGRRVRLDSQVGSLSLIARTSERVLPGTLLTHKGRWPSLEHEGANVNVLNPGTSSDMGRSSAVHGTLVTLSTDDRVV